MGFGGLVSRPPTPFGFLRLHVQRQVLQAIARVRLSRPPKVRVHQTLGFNTRRGTFRHTSKVEEKKKPLFSPLWWILRGGCLGLTNVHGSSSRRPLMIMISLATDAGRWCLVERVEVDSRMMYIVALT